MRVFELHFNPKAKEDRIFDSFIYEPESLTEKQLGNLYIVGELKKTLPQNAKFLNNLSSILKKEYYESPLSKSPENSLQEALKKANGFLETENKKGDISWLGNLNFAVLSCKDYILNFTKVGDVRILLQRGEDLLDISQNLEFQDTDFYPLKIFSSIANGKLTQGDKIVILTSEVASAISQSKNLLNQFLQVSDEKELKNFLKLNKKFFSEISGICLLLLVQQELQSKQTIILQRELPKFSFKTSFFNPVYKFWVKLKSRMPSLKLNKLKPAPKTKPASPKSPKSPKISKILKLKKVGWPRFSLRFKFPDLRFKFSKELRKKLILVFSLILILTTAPLIFKKDGEINKFEKEQQKLLEEAQAKVIMAENFLILKDEEKADSLFQEALSLLLPLNKTGHPLQAEASVLQKTIEEYLKK